MTEYTHATENTRALDTLIAAQAGNGLPTDDILVLVLPLFEQVASLHAHGRVASLDWRDVLIGEDGGLTLRRLAGKAPVMNISAVHRVQPHASSGLNIVGALQIDPTEDGLRDVSDRAVQLDASAPVERPVYLPGPSSWEIALGHHDEITDVFLLGMVLAALACGLDFSDPDDLRNFVLHRRDLFKLEARLHPVVAAVIVEMTQINRHERATDVADLATRLRTWRDQPVGVDVDRALEGASGLASRRTAVLGHLRDRLFDISRRNRLLYYKATAASVNMTVASVPLMLQVERIRADHICTWGGPFAADLLAGKAVSLQRWLRFEDQPYLPAALDRLIAEARRDRAEYGFSNLRVVVAFLRWHNLKEFPDERIVTPLLWLPVSLVKRKGVRDHYVVQGDGVEAEFNPVLRHHLDQLYGIQLPESVDLTKTTIEAIHADVLAQIRRTEPAVELRLVDKAAIRLVRHKALQRMQRYQRRKSSGSTRRVSGEAGLPPYSYAQDDYRPLGQALFDYWVRPSPLPQRFEAGAVPEPNLRRPRMVEVTEEVREGYMLEESDGHRFAWDLDLTQVTLANFNYRKMSLVRDYRQLIDEATENPAFDRVFSVDPREIETDEPPPLQPAEQWNVVAADATQNAAVSLARHGRSFIIQGPPGTGKSQTITNLIADYAGRDKRVLFVCEKRAALDVVHHRLKQSGLDPLCCLIHDSQADKKAFVADLKACYERWMSAQEQSEARRARRQAVVDVLSAHQARIEAFESAMADTHDGLGGNVRGLLRRIVRSPQVPDVGAGLRERLPRLAEWDRQRPLVDRLYGFIRERFGLNSFAGHPFARLSATLLRDEHPFSRAEQACADIDAQFDALDAHLESSGRFIRGDLPLDEAIAIAAESRWLLDQGLAAHLGILDAGSSAFTEVQALRREIVSRAEAVSAATMETAHWRVKLTAGDTEAGLNLTKRLESSVLRWLQPAWWRLRGELKRRYDFGKHAVHPGYTRVLEALSAEYAAIAAFDKVNAESCKRYDVGDMQDFMKAVDELGERLKSGGATHRLVDHLRQAGDPVAAAHAEAQTQSSLERLEETLREALCLPGDIPLGEVGELGRDLREVLDDLPDMLPLLRALHDGDLAVVDTVGVLDYPPTVLEALVLDEALKRLERQNSVLARFGGAGLAQSARAIAQGQRELHQLNAEVVGATQHRQFSEHVRQSMLSATQLDEEGKAFKKRYAAGRRELEHEFGKSMRLRSIRDLCDADTGLVVNDLKPIWLMSPLSVSDTLPLSPDLFDVVIFDEASQIPMEEAVPALSRARQVVVVGDEMQLPPTSFFSTSSSEGDDEIVVEEEGERIAINLDADSLLNQAARNLPATLLAWHYRSRHESLISFSNAAFYDGRLVTIPDRALEQPNEDVPPLHSDDEGAAVIGADELLERPISFHLLGDGVYEERCNVPEARFIARTVRELLGRETGLSIGIVAFSEAQQGAIESALDELAAEDDDFAVRLEREYVREDEGQFNGLFVKNLENVQGDERDIIILSICYAPGPNGKMLMNFGPINQRGGEKRLNVIFSRARHRMAVVTTIQAEAITNVHNDGAAALRGFLQFAQASAAGLFDRAQSVLGTFGQGARKAFNRDIPEDAIRDALAEALRARGHRVEINVGRSGFRCDLAIVAPDLSSYALAILLDDPGTDVSDSAERYVFRPAILRSFGWRVLDVPGKDWLEDPEAVLARIEHMLVEDEDRALDVQLEHRDPMSKMPARSEPSAERPSLQTDKSSTDEQEACERRLVCEQGASRKFWQVRVEGVDLTVTYGRIGTGGRTLLKQYETPERARREMDKLVAEKLRKDYADEAQID
ncbi:AAA domain-containing protein [Denitromonas iodatirespirans]|uniref:WGR domain-containing protein n=1 Tax=Denitromonas iodatirespirans TaxID=2795389 RepID=A0A944DDG3_DENI1|nr:AAA domain-containing protein [Denitromonas iodatirespirans]MBT0963447.1 WGR domain-containing protein [Denitromonas iodatirespirans]